MVSRSGVEGLTILPYSIASPRPNAVGVFYGNHGKYTDESLSTLDVLGAISRETGRLTMREACMICIARQEAQDGIKYEDSSMNYQGDTGE
jgi:hypothetical protein